MRPGSSTDRAALRAKLAMIDGQSLAAERQRAHLRLRLRRLTTDRENLAPTLPLHNRYSPLCRKGDKRRAKAPTECQSPPPPKEALPHPGRPKDAGPAGPPQVRHPDGDPAPALETSLREYPNAATCPAPQVGSHAQETSQPVPEAATQGRGEPPLPHNRGGGNGRHPVHG